MKNFNAWGLVMLLPLAAATLLLFPLIEPLGGLYNEGLLPERLATLAGVASDQLATFAEQTRLTAALASVVAAVLGVVLCVLGLRLAWRRRLIELRADRVRHYRGLAMLWCLAAVCTGLLVGPLMILLSPLRPLPGTFWIAFSALAAVVGGTQCFATIWGVTETRRSFRGK